MNCPQCKTNLPDSATFCYACGASARSTTFSYLPTGTPAWPTTVPQSPFYKPETTGVVDQEGQSHAPAAKDSAKPRRLARGNLILVTLFVLTPVVGVLATLGTLYVNGAIALKPAAKHTHVVVAHQTSNASNMPAPTSTATTNRLPTPTSFQTANSREVGITLEYPSDWVADAPQSTTTGNISVNFHPQQQLPVDMNVGRLSAANSTSVPGTGVINQATLESFGSGASLGNMKVLSNTPQHSTIGGTSWDEQDATFTTSNGDLVHAVSTSVKHHSLYYNIFYYALASVYDEAARKYYSQMLASFQFLA